ncbi:hypothetical protein IFM89_031572 [Coptis chinensis]|uniref:Protein kinase domain-containing protein n=1 Tax=Coptis chinensis TaxID=261450 RepID=A0A835HT90_9MAGN|nr:hypothetical protein IFM89_031572 [Coptis chinensis]
MPKMTMATKTYDWTCIGGARRPFHGEQDCPLDLSGSNFSLLASVCSNQDDRGKCCRYINAFVAVSVSRYANATTNLGVPPELSETCFHSVTKILNLYGIPPKVTISCGLGTKISFNYTCMGSTTVMQMLQSPKFQNVSENCMLPLSVESSCRRCLNAGILFLRRIVGAETNMTLSTCRDATFVVLASRGDNVSAIDMASCFFGVQGLGVPQGQVVTPELSPPLITPDASPSPLSADSPNQVEVGVNFKEHYHPYRLTLISAIGTAFIAFSVLLLVIMILLIRKKSKELESSSFSDGKAYGQTIRKCREGPSSMFRKFSYRETKKATDNFCTVIGRGGFGTVYKARFSDGFVAAVKRMDNVSEQAEDEFCREMELLGRLHHRHLVALRGFCAEKHERFLIYEYMENGSLKDHLHSQGRTPLGWQIRIQIAIDVANALEYLHFYCDPPLCHRDIKSSNILLDENFVAKVADFGLAHASRSGTISFEPVNTDIRGTPGYMDPEYVVTQELTEKSDIYSYGVLLLELLTSRRAIQDSKNLVEWSQTYMETESNLPELVDPAIKESFDIEQLQTLVTVVRWCTEREGRSRPSIKQVLRLLYETSDLMHSGFVQAVENEDFEGTENGERPSKGKADRTEVIFHSGDARCLPSSSSTSRSYCSRSFLLETGSPQSL